MRDVMAELRETEKELYSVADSLEGLFPDTTILDFRELVEHSEVGIGIELLLDQISEYDIVIPRKSYEILKRITLENVQYIDKDRVSILDKIEIREE